MIAQLAATFAILSLLSIGGVNAMVPEMHRQVVDLHHWMDDRTFATLVAIAQVAPGPNLLIVSLIGWSLAGTFGLMAATAAMVAPSSLVAVGLGRLVGRRGVRERIAPLRRALAPVALGLMAASGLVMAGAAYVGAASLAITASAAAVTTATKVSPLWSLGVAAALAVLLHHLAIAF